ncbi:hypothetical protein [Stigmatella erecta]|uniref:Uncharacterized protein n=1 Tax=Stigmatella erecta TaxID=83460 RepID=A0A1I0KLJ0_9BACT|nr:hypothetical protein [Stigmatella erecta]SEU25155.1 hypothetical protein SAMN05443639_111192 [Stigmatella erecta]
MPYLLRILALLLVLTAGGVFQTLALVSEGAVPCEDEEGTEEPCADCTVCLCCPHRALAGTPLVDMRVLPPASRPSPVPLRLHAPVPSGVTADIFQPPRA